MYICKSFKYIKIVKSLRLKIDDFIKSELDKPQKINKAVQQKLFEYINLKYDNKKHGTVIKNSNETNFEKKLREAKYYSSGKKIGVFDEWSHFYSGTFSDDGTNIDSKLIIYSKDEINNYAESYRFFNEVRYFVQIYEFKPNKI